MSLARRARGTDDAEVDETPETPAEPQLEKAPEPTPAADPQPLGAHASGSDAAREAFLKDAPPASSGSGEKSSAKSDGAKPAAEAAPAMTWEQLSHLAATLVDTSGQLAGRVMKRPDVPWALDKDEKAAVAASAEPVLKEYLGGTEVTPLAALLIVLGTLYGPRVALMLATKPGQKEEAPAPPAASTTAPSPPAPATPTPPAEKLPTLERVPNGKTRPTW